MVFPARAVPQSGGGREDGAAPCERNRIGRKQLEWGGVLYNQTIYVGLTTQAQVILNYVCVCVCVFVCSLSDLLASSHIVGVTDELIGPPCGSLASFARVKPPGIKPHPPPLITPPLGFSKGLEAIV